MKKINTKKLFIFMFISFILIVSVWSFTIYLDKYSNRYNSFFISLNGDSHVVLEVGSIYEEAGAVARLDKKDISKDIKINGSVDTSKVGISLIVYEVTNTDKTLSAIRTIEVKDTTSPVISLIGDNSITYYVGTDFNDDGVKALDNYDGDITNNVVTTNNINKNKAGTYSISYSVTDSNGNSSSITREIKYINKPVVYTQKVAVLNYHFFYQNGENCEEGICLEISKFKEQLDYLKENNFKTLTMEEFRAWMYGEITIPKKSVLITIDDGAMGTGFHNGNKLIPILEEYQMHATLFLITGWWDISNYNSEYLEIQSHTHNMHAEGICSNQTRGAQMLCSSYNKVLEDLKTSISVTNSKTAFCFPFYAYNETAIKAVKEAGFKLAFIGGKRKASRNDSYYKIPRYPIYNSTTLEQFKNMVN